MILRSVTYTSLARPGLQESDLEAIGTTAQRENAARGITGLLIFNGTHFLQIIEGAPDALRQLIDNLRRDIRHSAVEVRHDDPIGQRSFPGWSMEVVKVSANCSEAKATVTDRLPETIAPTLKNRVIRMTENISSSASF